MTSNPTGRPPIVMPATCNPFAGPAHRIAEAQGVSAATVYKWRREHPEMKPAPVTRERGPRGRPPKPDAEWREQMAAKYPAWEDVCASGLTHAAVGKVYGVRYQAVQQWREKLAR